MWERCPVQAEDPCPGAGAAPQVGPAHEMAENLESRAERVSLQARHAPESRSRFSKRKTSSNTVRAHMTHFISHFPALERRTTNVTQQIIFFFSWTIFTFKKEKLDCVYGLTAFIPTLKYLERTRCKLAFINNYHTCHGRLIPFSASVPVLFYDLCNTLKGTQLFPYSDKSRCLCNGLVYNDKICRE